MSRPPGRWPVDGHVHFHSLDRVAPTLDAAAVNFGSIIGGHGATCGAILLTQASRETVFEDLAAKTHVDGWTLGQLRNEGETLIARRGTVSLAVVCGRQVRAADGLEVLALGTLETFRDGLPFEEVVAGVQRSGALAVIPWGLGKWLGSRARRMEAVLTDAGTTALFLGDNGGRLAALGVPERLRALQKRGFRVLPGTDPFPFGGDHRRVGRFGFMSEIPFDAATPWRTLRTWLVAHPASPQPYGRACGPMRFGFNQVGIQLYNRFLQGRAV